MHSWMGMIIGIMKLKNRCIGVGRRGNSYLTITVSSMIILPS